MTLNGITFTITRILQSNPDTYYSINDIREFLKENNITFSSKGLQVILHRMVKKGTIVRIAIGYYQYNNKME